MQGTLGYLGDQPLPRLTGYRVQAGSRGPLGICPYTHDVREVQRVVVAPLIGGTEVAVIARFEP
ncbi:Uncharacterised protein [Mycobacteroides abscessus subsp. abscessus]|nr:Uncharacterised protein [Mycobacteroides abscessus subsp. abscessus]